MTRPCRVLLVDDEQLTTQSLEKLLLLRPQQYMVAGTAVNGKKALELLQQTAVDVALVDIRMPVMDGIALLEAVRSLELPVKIVILSAYRDFEYAQQAINLGACGYLLKPISKDKLFAAMEDVVLLLEQSQEADTMLRQKFERLAVCKLLDKGELRPELPAIFASDERKGLLLLQCDEAFPQAFVEECEALGWHCYRETHLVCPLRQSGPTSSTLAQAVRQLAREYHLPDVVVTASTAARPPQQLQQACMECKTASMYYFYLSSCDLILYSQIEPFLKASIRKAVAAFDQLKERMALDEPEAVRCGLHGLYYLLKESMCANPETVRQLFLDLLLHGQQLCRSREKSAGEELTQEELAGRIRRFDTLDTLYCFVEGEFERSLTNAGRGAVRNDEKIVEKVRDFCKHNYNRDCGLEDIADSLYISKSYLSQIFKEKTGVSIWNYFTDIRIEKAKELLADSRVKAVEAGELVGYKNASHFGRIFKSRVGVSPKEYQQNMAAT